MSSSSQEPAATAADVQGLARGYERLRKDVLEQRGTCCTGQGRSVLNRQGMAAWMRLCREERRSVRARAGRAARSRAPIRSELVGALTELVVRV